MLAFAQKQNQPQEKKFSGIAQRNLATPASLHHIPPGPHLQPTISNQAIQSLPQAKTEELEAGSPIAASPRSAHDFSRIPLYAKSTDGVQTDEAKERVAPPLAHEVVRSSGQPLDATTRDFFEPRFGHSFSHVRIHTGQSAAASALEMGARAYTLGEHVVLGGNAPPLSTEAGRKLIAHELTHVAQQRVDGGAAGTGDSRRAEAEASQAAEHVAAGASLLIQTSMPQTAPMLDPLPENPGGLRLQEPTLGGSWQSPIRSTTTTHVLQAFGTDSADLTSDHQATIQQIADALNAQPLLFGGFVTIVGHADRRGTEEHNRELGQRRADAARDSLMALVTDDTTRSAIRAYSLGEPEEGPAGDAPELRQVTITITQRTYDMQLPTPSPRLTPQAPPPTGIGLPLPPVGGIGLPPPLRPTRPQGPQLPEWFWRQLPARPAPPSLITQISTWLTGTIGREQIARIASHLAGGLGFNESDVRRSLNEAMISGGEEGVKKLLQSIIEALAGSPSSPPGSPYGPPINEVPAPPVLQLPAIPF